MNTVKREKHAMYKNNQTVRSTLIALVISVVSVFSISAIAQTAPSIEKAISNFVVAQSQQMMTQLNEQLQQTIANEMKEISSHLSTVKVDKQLSQTTSKDVELSSKTDEQVIAQVKSDKK